MGRVFFNTRLNMSKITADYQALASDSGKLFLVNPTATTDITLPTIATAGEGWNCRVMLTEDVAGTVGGMGQKVNIDFGSGNVIIGQIGSSSDVAGDFAVANDDFINFAATASPGDFVDIFTDGTNWYVQGMGVESGTTDVLFGTATV